jgi:hypothetical protein
LGSSASEREVMLIVTDGHGKPYAVFKPFRLTAAGWVSSGKGTPLAVTPLQWKPYVAPKKRSVAFFAFFAMIVLQNVERCGPIASNDPLDRSAPVPRTLACVVFPRAEDQAWRQGFVV